MIIDNDNVIDWVRFSRGNVSNVETVCAFSKLYREMLLILEFAIDVFTMIFDIVPKYTLDYVAVI